MKYTNEHLTEENKKKVLRLLEESKLHPENWDWNDDDPRIVLGDFHKY